MKKKNVKVCSFILLLTLKIILISCKSIPETKTNDIPENINKTVIEKKSEDINKKEKDVKENIKNDKEPKIEIEKNDSPKETKIVIKEAPNWYNYPPSSNEILYTLGMAKSTNMQFSLDKATDWAKQKLAVMIERKIYLITKDFFESTDINQLKLFSDILEQFSRKVSLNALSSLRIKERDVKAIGNYFVAFSLIELSLNNLSKNIDDAARFYDIEFKELKTNKSIKELLSELKKLKSSDFIN